MAYGGSKQILGFKKRFRYEDGNNSEQNGRWIMYEYTINSSLLGGQYSHKATDYVVCSMKKNDRGQQKEKADLGKKQRKSKQIGEKNEPGQGATGRKRKLKQTAISNSNDDHGDKSVQLQNKRLKSEQEALRIQQNQPVELACTSDVLQVLRSEETDSNSDFSETPIEDLLKFITFDFEDPVSNSNHSGEVDTEYYIHDGDECSQNKHLMGEQEGEEEALQEIESEAKIQQLLDVEELFSDIDQEFESIFGKH
ncbi:NAC transcription factor [Melia azedarach]|uniref:NAC transcription factor n=1 Tax=Melia azedarach TaxID=155640 RepID=A0ACC1X560_MELAZ|nr:NAC transcription factor [Melia azedarach]